MIQPNNILTTNLAHENNKFREDNIPKITARN